MTRGTSAGPLPSRPAIPLGDRPAYPSDAGLSVTCPGLPLGDDNAPVFAEPWMAQAFAMVLQLHQRGLFTWPEWAAALSAQISAAQAAGDADLGDTYYHHWLAALESLVAAKGAAQDGELARCARAWDHAADRTPHGQPIVLQPSDWEPA